MILILGGSYQGKREYALKRYSLTEDDLFTCTAETAEIDTKKRVIEHIERFALGCVRRQEEPQLRWESMIADIQDAILIADDISCGVVPVDSETRAWREAAGRANIFLAQHAESVIRVFCGLAQVIK